MPSGVSALWGFVANGHQAMRHVSFSLSEIPYGGFSPVRLQAGRQRQPSPSRAYMPPKLLRFPLTVAQRAIAALCRRRGGIRPNSPAQRPLARRRVIVSRRVIAYYGLIRASASLPPAYLLRLVDTLRGRGSQLLSACPCFRAIGLTPADRVVIGCSNATRDSLRRILNVSASALTRQLSSRRPVNEAAPFALCYGPETCLPFTDKGFYIRAFVPQVASQERRISLRGKSTNYRGWTYTNWTSSLVGCTRMDRISYWSRSEIPVD